MKAPFLIAVSGGSGSGKSTIVRLIQEHCRPSEILVVSQDHYYRDFSHLSFAERERLNFDHPDAIDSELLISHVQTLLKGQSIERPTYDFASHARTGRTQKVEPKPTLILDGIFALYFERLRQLANLRIFMDVGDDLRFMRTLKRDLDERGRTLDGVIQQYTATVRPMHIQFVEPTKHFADLVVYWENMNMQSVNMLSCVIQQYHSLAT